ncbi:hypothetical protein [Methylobacterium sp. A54F]
MSESRRLIHASSNGDCWFLVRGTAPDAVSVLHEPNAPSGGAASSVPVARFLAEGRGGPEHQALLRLIGSLVTDAAVPPSGVQPEAGAAASEPTPGEAG